MHIKWIGHACFLLTLKNGKKIITDPYDNTVGYDSVDEEADYVLVSHNHYDHNFTDGISGEYKLIDKPGNYKFDDIVLTGFELPHDDVNGTKRGKVTAFLIETENIKILHMADVGVVPDDSFFDALPKIDVLLVPVGGVYTIDAHGAFEILEKLQPNITIPMHYMTHVLKFALKGVYEFEQMASKEYDISHIGHSDYEISCGDPKKRPRIIIMQHSN